jgi:hypothetical protein
MLARLVAERATALRAAKRVLVLQNGTPVKLSRARWRVLTTALAGTGAGS